MRGGEDPSREASEPPLSRVARSSATRRRSRSTARRRKTAGKGASLAAPRPSMRAAPGMSRDPLVIPDGDLDERHQALPAVVALGQVEQLLEGLVGGEEVARVEDPDGHPESRENAVGRHARDSSSERSRARLRGAVRLLAGPPRGRRQAAFLLPWLSIWIGTLREAKPGGSGAVTSSTPFS